MDLTIKLPPVSKWHLTLHMFKTQLLFPPCVSPPPKLFLFKLLHSFTWYHQSPLSCQIMSSPTPKSKGESPELGVREDITWAKQKNSKPQLATPLQSCRYAWACLKSLGLLIILIFSLYSLCKKSSSSWVQSIKYYCEQFCDSNNH